MLPVDGHLIGKIILQTNTYRVVFKAVGGASHRDQPLAAADAVYRFLVAFLQNAALDHRCNRWQQVAIRALSQVAAIPLRPSASDRILRFRPGTITLAVKL